MDTKPTVYSIIAFGVGENSELYPMTSAVATSPMAAVAYFNMVVNQARGDKPLVDCMSKYVRNKDRVTRDMQLYAEIDERTVLVNISIVKAVHADGFSI